MDRAAQNGGTYRYIAGQEGFISRDYIGLEVPSVEEQVTPIVETVSPAVDAAQDPQDIFNWTKADEAAAQAEFLAPTVAAVNKMKSAFSNIKERLSNRPELIGTPRRKAVATLAAGAMAVTAMFGSFGSSRATEATVFPEAPAPMEVEFNGETLIADVEVQQPGVVGEEPCGPRIDIADATARFEAGELVVHPSETAAFFEAHPEVEQGHSDFMLEHYGQEFIDWIIANKDVVQPDLLKEDEENSIAREMQARMEFRVLDEDVIIQNHQCDKETGKIYPVNNLTMLKKGEQVWGFTFSDDQLDQMKEDGVELPDRAPMAGDSADDVEAVMLTNRGPCVNPLLERMLQTMDLPEVPEETTTTTVNTTTSTTSTTIPTTTSTTTPTTTSTTTPSTTTTSTTQPPVTYPTTTTTAPPKAGSDGRSPGPGGDKPENRVPTTSPGVVVNEQERMVPTTSTTAPESTTTTVGNTSTTQAPTTTTTIRAVGSSTTVPQGSTFNG